MRILILGGTGAMGIHLVNMLAKDGSDIFVTTRRQIKNNGRVHYIQGDAHDLKFINGLLDGYWDAIVDFMVYGTKEFKARVDRLLAATEQYVYLSSARVYAETKEPITEDSPRLLDVTEDHEYLMTDEYALAKARHEDILRSSGKINWTIVRPYITYSEQRLQLGALEKEDWLYRALRGRTIVLSEDINSKVTTLTSGWDVSAGIKSLIGRQDALGLEFNIVSEESIVWSEVLDLYLQVLESKLGLKPAVSFIGVREFEKFHHSPYQIRYDRLCNRAFDNDRIKRFVFVDGFVKVREGLQRSLEEFLEDPVFKRISWKSEALKDRYSNEKTNLSEIPGLLHKLRYIFYRYF